MAEDTCSVWGCEKAATVRGWCPMHYQRWRRYGTPLPPGGAYPKSGGYRFLHTWMNQTFPRMGRCEYCGSTRRRTQYASAGHRYTKHFADWFELCKPCHLAFDGGPSENVGHHLRERTHCPQGHAYDEANTNITPQGRRECRACKREKTRDRRAKRKEEQ